MLGASHTTGHFVTKLSPNIVHRKLLFLQEVYLYNYVVVQGYYKSNGHFERYVVSKPLA